MPLRSTRVVSRLFFIGVWLLLWQWLSSSLGEALLLPSPLVVLQRLFVLLGELDFWSDTLFSLLRIVGGFFLGLLLGIVFAVGSARFWAVREFLAPAMAILKASPVASFTILLLIWVPSRNLSLVTTLMMVLPIIYTNLLAGISATDPQLLEMADLFEVGRTGRLRCIYLSQVLPFLRSACALSLGLSWKAGIAAEIIGIPTGSVGERLYQAKIFLDTPDLFAWTIVVVLMSLVFGKLFLVLLDLLVGVIERM